MPKIFKYVLVIVPISILFNFRINFIKIFCMWIKRHLYISIFSIIFGIIFVLCNFPNKNFNLAWYLIIFTVLSIILIISVIHIIRELISVGFVDALLILCFSTVLITYLVLSYKYISISSNVSKTTLHEYHNCLFATTLTYFPTLASIFIAILTKHIEIFIKHFKKVFKYDENLDIYSSAVIDLISVFGIMITFASIVFNSTINKLNLVYSYWFVYILAPLSLVAISEKIKYKLQNKVQNYGINYKINKIYNKLF